MRRTEFALVLTLAAVLPGLSWAAPARPAPAARPRPAKVKPERDRIDRAVNQLLAQSDLFWHNGDYESVRACFAIITDLDPKYVEGWQDYGWLLWSGLGRNDAAMRVFKRGLAYNPDTYELYFEIGNLENHQRRFLSAAQWMAKATAFKAPFSVWHMRAHCLEYAGEIDKAKATWKTIIAKFPNDPPARTNLKRLEEGRIHRNPVIGVEPLKPSPRSRGPVEPVEPPSAPDPNSI